MKQSLAQKKNLRPPFKSKITDEDKQVIIDLKFKGMSDNQIYVVMRERRPDVHPITTIRWIERSSKWEEK